MADTAKTIIHATLIALIVASLCYTGWGSVRDYQASLLSANIKDSLRDLFETLHQPGQACSRTTAHAAITCLDARHLVAQIPAHGAYPLTITLTQDPQSGVWSCQANADIPEIPTACRPENHHGAR